MIFPDIGVEKITMVRTRSRPNLIFNNKVNRPGREIIEEECSHYGITLPEFFGQSKKRFLVKARWTVWFRLSTELGWSTTRIGELCNRDHTTILNGLSKYKMEATA
jgi:chromosomal replication initiation ATPase DnaA